MPATSAHRAAAPVAARRCGPLDHAVGGRPWAGRSGGWPEVRSTGGAVGRAAGRPVGRSGGCSAGHERAARSSGRTCRSGPHVWIPSGRPTWQREPKVFALLAFSLSTYLYICLFRGQRPGTIKLAHRAENTLQWRASAKVSHQCRMGNWVAMYAEVGSFADIPSVQPCVAVAIDDWPAIGG